MPQIRPALLAPALLAAGMAAAGAEGTPTTTPPPPRPEPAAAETAPGQAAPAPAPSPAPVAPIDPARIDPAAAALFAQPAIAQDLRVAVALAEAGDLAAAAAALDGLLARHPEAGEALLARAAVAMLQGDAAAALGHLEAAAAAGAATAALLADPLFAPLAADPAADPNADPTWGPRTAALAALPPPPAPPPPVPAPITDGRAPVGPGNTAWNPATGRLEVFLAPAAKPAARVVPARKVAAYEILGEHAKAGRAAGNHGDVYDNRDRGHSVLDPKLNPQLARSVYDPAARAADLDYGLNDRLIFDRPVLGNSSTALTGGPFWRSLPRQAFTQGDGAGPVRLWQTAAANHLYVYPAHKDFGPENGDLFPANTPYILVSRGSSGSDRPFLEAIALILAALRPDTKAKAVEDHLLVPTVQMIFRRSLQNVRSRESYLSGDAHPAAFEGFQINTARMVSLANSIRADALPAEVRIRVETEELGIEGIDYFGQGLTEQLFDTPGAVARIWRSRAGRRSMTVSAADSRDANGRPLAFTWALLQGDPAKVRIEPLDGGTRARITLDWHDPFPISEEVPLATSRVDIGVFASNGVHDSAPAILSWYFPPDATRTWEAAPDGDPDGALRLAAIDHRKPKRPYSDPALFPAADWEDRLAYAADGRLAGWTRVRDGRPPEDFDATGARILTRTAQGAPDRVVPVAHPLRRNRDGTLAIVEQDAPQDAQQDGAE